ncbi:semaphorin-4D isoform X3 [Anguilla anguilla]|nr:semaphorin-4D isoform X3 [Anguilla anguilla]XP_035246869.1 semaphorin-4D isoform X3 [Anguilla anguilla]XP_035246870.1 semaphorin-4D isoform X3 [Anguilla anguilla]XP_035246871.1 semaphorin-4D isoform X3 [Anguilla anguilla]XP_035246873.1 semaphorin-4D isoform X3 [Anguilla anguilla]XP_035246874.1 semaphorin-4D isoform X3 [Anguilla anguilla]XP_035246875.1 semaphorin-4D isoform X3 [Anguilla anguilla]
MAFSVLGVFLGLLLEVSTHGPTSIPRMSWKHQDVNLIEFSEEGIFNYSTLLLSEEKEVLYVGAREAIFELSMKNVSVKTNKVIWKVPENHMSMCILKGKSKETDCLNYIRVLQVLNDDSLYVCGTHAFQPLCDYLSLKDFKLLGQQEDGRGKCSFDPAQSFTTVMVDGELYSGTAYNFLGSEPIISRYSLSQSLLRTEYSTSWLNEPSFVFADVIREGKNSLDGEDDKIYYFFTEVSVEYEFFGKLLIPRIARVCKGDLGGQRTLQKKWTSFLKAKLVCSMPELNFVFNVVHDVFILKTPDWKDTVIYGVFTSQWGNVGLSAVCAYNMSSVEEVFSKGKYMQKATVEQSHTKWVRYNGITPSPRPGACINNNNRLQNINSSLHLPDKTLQFVKDHPLLEDPVLPIGNGPKLITKDVNYTQIAVERVQALDNNVYDVIFTGTDKGILHKSIVYDGVVHTIEEIQLLRNVEPIKTLLLSSQGFLYAGSDSGVVQSPTAFCDKYTSCEDCVLARDPYCAWAADSAACLNIFQAQDTTQRNLIQSLNGDADKCPNVRGRSLEPYHQVVVKPGSSVELPCHVGSNLAQAVWTVNGSALTEASRFHLLGEAGLLIYSMAPEDQGRYECWSLEWAGGKNFTRLVTGYALTLYSVKRPPAPDPSTPLTSTAAHNPTTATEASPAPISPVESSSLSTVGSTSPVSSSSSSSSTSTSSSSPSPELWSTVGGMGVRLLPPLLTDQVWGVEAHEAFLLFCLALGPSDLNIRWKVNGKRLETPVTEYRHAMATGEVFVSSWLRLRGLRKESQYQCVATSHAGDETSKILIGPSRKDKDSVVSRDLKQWRTALTDHEKLLQNWKEAWVCFSCNVLQSVHCFFLEAKKYIDNKIYFVFEFVRCVHVWG